MGSFCTGPGHGYFRGFTCHHCEREEKAELASYEEGVASRSGIYTCRHGKIVPLDAPQGNYCDDCYDMGYDYQEGHQPLICLNCRGGGVNVLYGCSCIPEVDYPKEEGMENRDLSPSLGGNLLHVELEGGKYTITQTVEGKTEVKRYGEPWLGSLATTPGGKMILGMAYEIERLRKALDYYADEKNWQRTLSDLYFSPVDNDAGEKARRALAGEDD